MRFGITLPAFADFSDPRALAKLAHEAESVGWDGFFIWDHIFFDPTFHPVADTWVALAAVALHTEHLRIGTMITPVARRRPWKLARETVSVDQLSNGRLTLGVGLGDPVQWDFGFFEEETDARARARRLDAGLDVLTGLWTGEPFSYAGEQYNVKEVTFRPTPVQSPRIPIWVGGWWPNKPPLRRAARWDGVCPGKWGGTITPDEWRELLAYIQKYRTAKTPFDAVHSSVTPGEDLAKAAEQVKPYADAGVTWWVEPVDPWRFGWNWEEPWNPKATEQMRERTLQGPPRR
ncbi:MAG TPA: LLM class flavin-dependent oxidoreductase [Anaerolineales bacterium]|nr:LLM class flavin-dependent oxidoreductase [Anaerolineales bacterium]